MKPYVVLISGLLLMAPAAAQTSDTNAATEQPAAQSEAQPEGQAAADPNRRICRKVETNTGSRVPHRTVCLTEQQWRNYRPN